MNTLFTKFMHSSVHKLCGKETFQSIETERGLVLFRGGVLLLEVLILRTELYKQRKQNHKC